MFVDLGMKKSPIPSLFLDETDILNEVVLHSDNVKDLENSCDSLIKAVNNNASDIVVQKIFAEMRKAIFVEFNIQTTFEVTDVNGKGMYFGAYILPNLDMVYQINEKIINNDKDIHFKTPSKGFVVIDGKCLRDSGKIKFTAQELTSIILHELGHKLLSTTYYEEIFGMIAKSISDASSISIIVSATTGFIPMLPFIIVKIIANYGFYKFRIKQESKADSLAVRFGYGPFMSAALNKLGKVYFANDFLEFLNNFTQFIFGRPMDDLRARKNRITKLLEDELQNPATSKVEKEMIKKQLADMKYDEVKKESSLYMDWNQRIAR